MKRESRHFSRAEEPPIDEPRIPSSFQKLKLAHRKRAGRVKNQSDSADEGEHMLPFEQARQEKHELGAEMKIIESPHKYSGMARNPFTKFYSDSNSRIIMEDDMELKLKGASMLKHAASPKDDSSGSAIEMAPGVDADYENRQFLENPIDPKSITFFQSETRTHLFSKLIWFKPNSKNGRNLVYDSHLGKCKPIYRCEGCMKEFKVPSALGGHLSSCQAKEAHKHIVALQRLKESRRTSTKVSEAPLQEQRFSLRSSNRHFVKTSKDQEESADLPMSVLLESKEDDNIYSSSESFEQTDKRSRKIKREYTLKKTPTWTQAKKAHDHSKVPKREKRVKRTPKS